MLVYWYGLNEKAATLMTAFSLSIEALLTLFGECPQSKRPGPLPEFPQLPQLA
jgi:hypothetical protein